jgi:hypothetical protein
MDRITTKERIMVMSKGENMKERLESDFEGIVLMDGYDDCIVGIGERCGMESVAIYDITKIINKLIRGGMTYEEAREYYEFNQLGAWVGDRTPIFMDTSVI